jgi:hypothetical protein
VVPAAASSPLPGPAQTLRCPTAALCPRTRHSVFFAPIMRGRRRRKWMVVKFEKFSSRFRGSLVTRCVLHSLNLDHSAHAYPLQAMRNIARPWLLKSLKKILYPSCAPTRNRTTLGIRPIRRRRLTTTALLGLAPARSTRASAAATGKHQRLSA